ncbi:MAG: DUF4190 domain-containing protein [Anaerolineales bacterium]
MDQQFQPTPQFEPAPPPPPMPAPASDKKGLAIAALVLGILSLCSSWFFCGGLLGVIGVILGLLGMKSSGRTMAIIGIVLSVVGLILTIIFIIVYIVSGPSIGNIFNQMQYQLTPGG